MKLSLDENFGLNYMVEDKWTRVELKPCFPLSHQNVFFSLRDKDGNELELIESLEHLDDKSKCVLERYIEFKTFRCVIKGIYSVDEDFGLRNFNVLTNMGKRSLQMPLDVWPMNTINQEFLLNDIYGETFIIRELEFGFDLLKPYI